MKNFLLIFIAIVTVVSCSDANGTNHSGSEVYEFKNFTGLSVHNSIKVEVNFSPEIKVEVLADEAVKKYVVTEVENGTLVVRMNDSWSMKQGRVRVIVNVPHLESIKAESSSSVVFNDELKFAGSVKLDANSSANIAATVKATTIKAEATSSANIVLAGTATESDFTATSSASINAKKLMSKSCTAIANSSANIQLYASDKLDANASSSATISYSGGPENLRVKTNSSGKIRQED